MDSDSRAFGDGVKSYESAAVRDAQLPNPAPGTAAVTLDDGALSVYYGRQLGWRPPWTTAWGQVASRDLASTVTITSADGDGIQQIPGLDLSFDAVEGRRYRLTLEVFVGFESPAPFELVVLGDGLPGANRKAEVQPMSFGGLRAPGATSLEVSDAAGPVSLTVNVYAVFTELNDTVIYAGAPHRTRVHVADIGPALPPTIE